MSNPNPYPYPNPNAVNSEQTGPVFTTPTTINTINSNNLPVGTVNNINSGLISRPYSGNVFVDLCTFYRDKYVPQPNGQALSIADLPNRARRLVLSYIVDWIFVGICLGLMGIWFAEPPRFYFRLDDKTISYPVISDVSIGEAAITLIITLGPLTYVALAQIWVRDLRDFHQSALSVLELFCSTQMICMWMWFLVGGLRPTFLDICQPNLNAAPAYVTPGGVQWFSDQVCTCSHHDLVKAKHSLPSDHAASAVAVTLFLTIYTSAKLKLFDNKSHFWKLFASLPFVVVGLFISFARLRDGQHSFRDIIIGIIIGAFTGPIIYRLNFCSLIGPDNHIPCRYTWLGRMFGWKRGRFDVSNTYQTTNITPSGLIEFQTHKTNPQPYIVDNNNNGNGNVGNAQV